MFTISKYLPGNGVWYKRCRFSHNFAIPEQILGIEAKIVVRLHALAESTTVFWFYKQEYNI